ncbi:sugar-binding protein [Paenibacillus arenilitoris]|uniref:Ig-like domain repeat protein n=1 Tax=Paenibacillus arenilitoris TaxID=2772299 RepID=A0A927CFW0_9BACL|nr:sugar-binding protein [Paenibacillus arenilitoris]MBD2867329.1 Ig-like domain repeat protein [Paenibacillus arenilitoris]
MSLRKIVAFICIWSLLATLGFQGLAVQAEQSGFVDEMDNFALVHQRSNIRIEKADQHYFGNDASRMVRNTTAAGHMLYKTSAPIDSFTAYSYSFIGAGMPLVGHRFYASADGSAFTEVSPSIFGSGAPVNNWQLVIYEDAQVPSGTLYLKIEFIGETKAWTPQLSKLVVNQNVGSVVADPPTGLIGDQPLTVALSSATSGASIFYKLNDDVEYRAYTEPLSLAAFTSLDTYATKEGLIASPVKTYKYYAQADMLIDRYGQVKTADFPMKVTSDAQLQADVASDQAYYDGLAIPSDFDELGGLKGSKEELQLEATGFFNIQQVNGKPILVSPSGAAYFSLGMNGITNNETFTLLKGQETKFEWVPPYNGEYGGAFQGSQDVFSFYMANKYRKTGAMPTNEAFFAEAVDRLKKWGFNSAGAWGSGALSKQNGLPYTLVLPLNGMSKPSEIKIFDIFADDAEARIDSALAASVPALKDDPLLIGYFVDNEYHYEKFFTAVPKLKASKTGIKKRLVQMLQEKYVDIAAFNASWETDYASFTDLNEAELYIDTPAAGNDIENFFRLYLDTYYSTVKRLFEKYDTNHLLLGDRWLTLPMMNTKIRGILAEEAGKYMDVISINHYAPNLDVTMLNEIYTKSGGKPIMLSEWSYGTAEQGLDPIVAGAAANEQERAWRYRNYVEGAASLGYIVGTHWFDYVDQAATGRWFEGLTGERYNTGLINVADRPYKTFLDGVMQTHHDIYAVMFGEKEPFFHDFGDEPPGGGTGNNLTIDIPYTSVPIPLDGEINGYPEGAAGKATLTADNRVGGSGGDDITADYAFAWDEQHLYVTAQINEPTPMMNNNPNSNVWKGDGVELFFGPSELEQIGPLLYDDRQIIMSAGPGAEGQSDFWLWFNTGRQRPIQMFRKAAADGQGYVLEAAIPWEAVRMQPASGREFLFDFGFNESEDGNSRKRQYEWNGTNRNNLDRGLWGNAKLIGASDGAGPVVTVTGVEDGGEYTDQATPAVSVEEPDGGSGVKQTSIRLNGSDWLSGTAITEPGAYVLTVEAEDHASNQTVRQISFAVYASTMLAAAQASGAYSDPAMLAATLTDRNGSPITGETVSFLVDGDPAGTAVTDEQGTAELAYSIQLGAGSYAVEAGYAQSESLYFRGSSSQASLTVSREDSDLAYEGSRLGAAGQPVTLAVQVSEPSDGSQGTLGGLTVTFSVYAIEPDGAMTQIVLPTDAATAVTDAAGLASAEAVLPAGLYEASASLPDNPYYIGAGTASRLAVAGKAPKELKVKGHVELPSGPGLDDDWKEKLHLDVEFKNGVQKQWTLKANSGKKIGVQSEWMAAANGKAYMQGSFLLNGEAYTIRIMTQEAKENDGRVSIQAWKGQSDGLPPDYELLHAEFKGTIKIK